MSERVEKEKEDQINLALVIACRVYIPDKVSFSPAME